MSLAFYSHADCRAHFMGRGHPECPERLDAIHDHLIATGLADYLDMREPPLATAEQLARAHASAHVSEIQAAIEHLCVPGEHCQIDPDTSAGPGRCGLFPTLLLRRWDQRDHDKSRGS